MILLNGKRIKIVGGDFNGSIKVVRLFIGAELMEVNKEDLRADGGYLEIYKEIQRVNKEAK